MIVLGQTLNRVKSGRAGVIPYIYDNNDDQLYFLFGIDKTAKELTDFGGGIKKGETPLIAAVREFNEESRSLFDPEDYNINRYTNCVSLHDRDMSIIFLPVKRKWLNQAKHNFDNNESCKKSDEMSFVEWHDLDSFCELSFNPRKTILWRRVQKFLSTNIGEVRRPEFISMLKMMYDA